MRFWGNWAGCFEPYWSQTLKGRVFHSSVVRFIQKAISRKSFPNDHFKLRKKIIPACEWAPDKTLQVISNAFHYFWKTKSPSHYFSVVKNNPLDFKVYVGKLNNKITSPYGILLILSLLYLHCHRLSLEEPIFDQHCSYIDERQLIMWCCH